jgi:uncharacterized protein (DUF697 family)
MIRFLRHEVFWAEKQALNDQSAGRAQPCRKGSAMAEKSSATSETGEAAADTPETREQMASKLVDRFALWSGVAGLVPIPVLDVAAVGGLQIQMVRRISQIYDVDFSENRGKALIASIAGSMIPATSGIGAASVLKAVPVIGTIAGGFVMPALSAGATYAIGKAFIQHFATGGTLLDFNPPDYRQFIKAQRDMWDSRKNRAAKSPEPGAATGP